MACPSPDRVLEYMADQLPRDERAAVDAHVDGCEECHRLFAELARTAVEDVVTRGSGPDPTQIGRYRVDGRLGEGGMGAVFSAYDPQLDRKIAVKLVHPDIATPHALERLQREGRALARLAHPNVVAVYDAGIAGNQVFIAMELVEGETLDAWLAAGRRPWRDVLAKVLDAARGVAAAHAAGIIHRDIKPQNVLVDRVGRARVVDFGLAGQSNSVPPTAADVSPMRITKPGTIIGTPMFMSPEQRGGDEVGPASDQYSLCAAVRGALGDAPGWVRRAIQRGLEPDPADRYPSMEALIAAIDPSRRAWRYRALGAGGLAITSALAVYLLTRGSDPTGAACGDATARTQLEPRVAELTSALRASDLPRVAETVPRIEIELRRHLDAIATAEQALCAQAPRSPEARETLDEGLACLAERRDEVSSLIDRLGHLDASDVRHAVALVHSLSPVAGCANATIIATQRLPFPFGGTRVAVEQELHAAYEAKAVGQLRAALAHADRAVAHARPVGGLLLARALIVAGEHHDDVDGFARAEPAYREGIAITEAIHADDLRAYAMAALTMALARTPGREKEALALSERAEAAVARARRQSAYTPMLQKARGLANVALGNTRDGIALLEAALAAARVALPPDDPRMPDYIDLPGIAYDRDGNAEKALTFYDEAYRVAAEVLGPSHPETQRYAIQVAIEHAALGQTDVAIRELTEVRAGLAGMLPDDSLEALQVDQALGVCYLMQNKPDDALREHTQRQQALLATGRAKSAEMAASWVDLGDVERSRKDFAAAAASYRRSITEWEALVGTNDARLATPLTRLGEAELALAHAEPAIAPLERALALLTAMQVQGYVLATTQLPLARALWSEPAARPRARGLANAARKAFAASGARGARALPDVDRWLADHP